MYVFEQCERARFEQPPEVSLSGNDLSLKTRELLADRGRGDRIVGGWRSEIVLQ